MDTEIKIFKTPEDLAVSVATDIKELIRINERKGSFSLALSGGRTPEIIFPVLGGEHSGRVSWQGVDMFWVDERCVSPDDRESNYGVTKRLLLDPLSIPARNIHRIRGEEEPFAEAERYSAEIKKTTSVRNGLPYFDLVLLGLGEDGHTASIFPGSEHLFNCASICSVASHPLTGQKRITLTGKVINNTGMAMFIVTGESKAQVVADIINESQGRLRFPASYVRPVEGRLSWYLDEAAASLVRKKCLK